MKRRFVCTYIAPSSMPVEWDRPPPASMVIGNGGRVCFGDFSVVFDGTDTGKRCANGRSPWLVCWETAVGTVRPTTIFTEHAQFDRYADAIREAKTQEHARLRRLGAM